MSKADEMFEKLGLYKEISCVSESEIWCIDEETKIIFDGFDHDILLKGVGCIPLILLQAINEKVKELGWNE